MNTPAGRVRSANVYAHSTNCSVWYPAHMAIRLRRVDGFLIAVCAARTVHQPGDLYLDDEAHHALTSKFGQDFNSEGFGDYPEDDAHNLLREAAESNNENRDWWDATYKTEH